MIRGIRRSADQPLIAQTQIAGLRSAGQAQNGAAGKAGVREGGLHRAIIRVGVDAQVFSPLGSGQPCRFIKKKGGEALPVPAARNGHPMQDGSERLIRGEPPALKRAAIGGVRVETEGADGGHGIAAGEHMAQAGPDVGGEAGPVRIGAALSLIDALTAQKSLGLGGNVCRGIQIGRRRLAKAENRGAGHHNIPFDRC